MNSQRDAELFVSCHEVAGVAILVLGSLPTLALLQSFVSK